MEKSLWDHLLHCIKNMGTECRVIKRMSSENGWNICFKRVEFNNVKLYDREVVTIQKATMKEFRVGYIPIENRPKDNCLSGGFAL